MHRPFQLQADARSVLWNVDPSRQPAHNERATARDCKKMRLFTGCGLTLRSRLTVLSRRISRGSYDPSPQPAHPHATATEHPCCSGAVASKTHEARSDP